MRNKLFFSFLISIFSFSANINAQEIRFGVQVGVGAASAFNYYPKRNDVKNAPELKINNSPILMYSANLYFSYPLKQY